MGIVIFFSCFSLDLTKPKNHKLIYESKSADKLFSKVKILCLVLTQPKDHKTKAIHVKNTWGRKCNKLIFLSTQTDENLGAIGFPFNETREVLWGKVKQGFKLAYHKYLNDYDWFLKADDDSYFVMENLRHFLYQFNPQTSILIGQKYAFRGLNEGYMAGGGYALSRKAVKKLITRSFPSGKCSMDDGGSEDLEMGKCLQNLALIVDAHNNKSEKEFFSIDITYHMNEKFDNKFWYYIYNWFNVTQGNLSCCSDTFTNMHYVDPKVMHYLEYLIYNVYPFGMPNNHSSKLPRKLTFNEIINASEVRSYSPNYAKHEAIHQFDDDEKF